MRGLLLWLALLCALCRADAYIEEQISRLLSGDPPAVRQASRELHNLRADALPALRSALRRPLPAAQRLRLDTTLRDMIVELVLEYQTSARQAMSVVDAGALIELEADSLGVVSDSLDVDFGRPSHWPSLRDSNYTDARDALTGVGLIVTEAVLDPYLWAGTGLQELQLDLLRELEPQLRAALSAPEELRAAFLAEGPLSAAWLQQDGLGDLDQQAWFEQVRAEVARQYVERLRHPEPAERELARAFVFRLDTLALPELEAADSFEARRMLQRVRFGVSDVLYQRLGHSFQGYHDLPAPERRALVDAAARLGGKEAIGCLRKLLEAEAELSIRLLAAQGLVRQGDESAIAFIENVGMAELLQIPQVTTAIYMDQGIKYLKIQKYARAAAEFLKILKLDPDNEVAHYNLACAYSLDGKLDAGVASLRRSVELGYDDLEHLRSDSDLDNLREHPDYLKLIRELEQRD